MADKTYVALLSTACVTFPFPMQCSVFSKCLIISKFYIVSVYKYIYSESIYCDGYKSDKIKLIIQGDLKLYMV